MSPSTDHMRKRFRQYQCLVQSCNIDWILPWPIDALFQVATVFMSNSMQQIMTQNEQLTISKLFVFAHEECSEMTTRFFQEQKRKVYITSKNYLDMVKFYMEFT
jgi:hypothetical protein